MSEVRNLLLAVVSSVFIMVAWKFAYEKFFTSKQVFESPSEVESVIPEVDEVIENKTRERAVNSVPRAGLKNAKINASVSLVGAVVDDLSLTQYLVSTDKDAERVFLMSPEGTTGDSMVEFGWVDPKHEVKVPGKDTLWTVEERAADNSFALCWDNGEGLLFRLKFALDDSYMVQVIQEVENHTNASLQLAYYGRINRVHDQSGKSYWISHEGAIGSFGGGVEEWTYKDLLGDHSFKVNGTPKVSGSKNWIGFADKYWFSALIPAPEDDGKVAFRAHSIKKSLSNRFQVDFSKSLGTIEPHTKASASTFLFMGAKELSLLDKYKKELSIHMFDKAVDFGVLYFITKPVFLLLQYFHKLVGNFGLAILMLTVTIKLIVLPLSTRSYVSMFKLRKIQPEITRIKELYKSDSLRASKEISVLFKKHGVSPVSGFLPLLVQVPVFFALYKVLFVTIEMRHAPLFAWIRDLSSQDSANILNLFGLIPFNPPMCVGILPVVLGITMVIQQKMSQSNSETQDAYGVMKFLPYVFVFIFASFPSGLVLYWICSNVITILQQLLIKRFVCRDGVGGVS